MAAILLLSLVAMIFSSSVMHSSNALSSNHYHQTCPNAESMITKVVRKGIVNDKTVPAALLRMHFHDCFVRVIKSIN